LKWIVDGVIEPLGARTTVPAVLNATVNYPSGSAAGVLATQYNLSFTLDWTRNLAAAATTVRNTLGARTYAQAGIDVRITPFTYNSGASYIENSGYRAEILPAVLYVLTVSEPDTFFLAAIRRTDAASPEVHYFNDCAAIFPYIDSVGRFTAVVFQNGEEFTLDQFLASCEGNFVHLSRVKSNERFTPR
jgi:hypothetical protein